jgi:hypothetical protein
MPGKMKKNNYLVNDRIFCRFGGYVSFVYDSLCGKTIKIGFLL